MSDVRLRELAGRVIVVGLRASELSDEDVRRLDDVRPAGVILFARNLGEEASARRLVARVRSVLDEPLVLVDQEGGRVDRLRAWRGRSPGARELAAQGAAAVRAEAERTARDLVALGIDFNCVPVVDLDEGNDANGIGDRSFGSEPEVVVALAREVLAAHAAAGVLTSLKHFPGLGRTAADTHVARPSVGLTREDLLERELVPYRALVDEAPAVMVSHAAYPALTGSEAPASLSRAVVEDLLRRDLGFGGLVVTDDLDMGAVGDRSAARRCVEALGAGCDLLLLCQDVTGSPAARDAVVDAVRTGELALDRLERAVASVEAAKRRRGRLPIA